MYIVTPMRLCFNHPHYNILKKYSRVVFKVITTTITPTDVVVYIIMCLFVYMQVQVLQKQMNSLTDNQHLTDERYARTKEENAALQARVHMLEEQLRDTELRCEERLASEERRHRELVTRVDREKQLHIDNCAIR